MNLLAPHRRFDQNCPELIDRPGMAETLLRKELQTLESLNRRLGGHRLALQYVRRFVSAARPDSLHILDLATGAADIPRAIVAWARQCRLPVKLTAVDGNNDILRLARELGRAWPEIRFEQHDLRALPYAPESFDLVLCSLTLHHFGDAEAAMLLRRIHETARHGYIVNDLRRNWPAIWTTEVLARTAFRRSIFGHDAVQSCRAAFTVGELRVLAEQAGLNHFQIHRHHAFFRMVLEGRK